MEAKKAPDEYYTKLIVFFNNFLCNNDLENI